MSVADAASARAAPPPAREPGADPWLPPRTATATPKRPRGFKHVLRHAASTIAFFLVLLVILLAVLWRDVVITVPAGHVGVLWLRFFGGTVTDRPLNEGLHLIFPWDRIYIYNARPLRTDVAVVALSEEGLSVEIDLTVTTVIDVEAVGTLHKSVGPAYVDVVVEPVVVSAVRTLVASYSKTEIYQVARDDLEPQLQEIVNRDVGGTLINFEESHQLMRVSQLSVREVTLPRELRRAIEEKLSAEQAALRYQYILDRERLESQRKEIEANGIRRFQEIVTPAISEEYLRWRGIDATLQLAQSPNAKVIVIGGGADGLPLILDGTGRGDAPAAAPPAPDPPAGSVPVASEDGTRPLAGREPFGYAPFGNELSAATSPSGAPSSGNSGPEGDGEIVRQRWARGVARTDPTVNESLSPGESPILTGLRRTPVEPELGVTTIPILPPALP